MSDAQVVLDSLKSLENLKSKDALPEVAAASLTAPDLAAPALRPSSEEICARIEAIGIIPFLRFTSANDVLFAADMLAGAGLPICELGMSLPETSQAEALDILSHLVKHLPKTIVGAGNIVDTETARRCLDLGAAFLSSDAFLPRVVELAAKEDVVVLAGALTPTEVISASQAGSDFVKLCPISAVEGPAYIRSMKYVLPEVRFVAAGGIDQHNALALLEAGASAICVGEALIPAEAIHAQQHGRIRELARRFQGFVASRDRKKRARS